MVAAAQYEQQHAPEERERVLDTINEGHGHASLGLRSDAKSRARKDASHLAPSSPPCHRFCDMINIADRGLWSKGASLLPDSLSGSNLLTSICAVDRLGLTGGQLISHASPMMARRTGANLELPGAP